MENMFFVCNQQAWMRRSKDLKHADMHVELNLLIIVFKDQ